MLNSVSDNQKRGLLRADKTAAKALYPYKTNPFLRNAPSFLLQEKSLSFAVTCIVLALTLSYTVYRSFLTTRAAMLRLRATVSTGVQRVSFLSTDSCIRSMSPVSTEASVSLASASMRWNAS